MYVCMYAPKLSHAPLLIKQKLISTPPPPFETEKSLLPLIPSYLVYLLDFFLRYKHHFKWLFHVCRRVIRITELVSFSHELGDSSSSTASLVLRFPRAWVRTWSINSALLPLILRPFCFSSFLVSAFTSFTCFIYHTLNLYCY